jgi:inner membrane protein
MDSITQAALGAAVAEAGMGGKRLGNKAILWGIALGTLPDLDVLANPWLDSVQRLEWHRGISHSLFFMVLASPLIGWGISRLHHGRVSVARAGWTVFAILFTHVLIDVFTVYGTMVFEPFSDRRIGANNLFIIDPLFTLPLLIGLVVAWFSRRDFARRRFWNWSGLALCTLYVIWSFGIKAMADQQFEKALRDQGLAFTRRMSAPTPFNSILWRGLADGPNGYWVGYWSLLDREKPIRFDFIPTNQELLADVAETRAVRRLIWFSDGYFSASRNAGELVISDWRFGEIRNSMAPLGPENPPASIFAWRLESQNGELLPVGVRVAVDRGQWFQLIWKRMLGEE